MSCGSMLASMGGTRIPRCKHDKTVKGTFGTDSNKGTWEMNQQKINYEELI